MFDDVLLVLPLIHPAYGANCVASMHESVRARVCVIDNTEDGFDADVAHTIRPSRNYGVARSWNAAIECHPAESYVLLSAQVRFGTTGGVDLCSLAAVTRGHVCSPSPTHWHSVIFPAGVLAEVGTFDENFYPAYYEDADMTRRCLLAGIDFDDRAVIDARPTLDGHGVDALRHQHPGVHTVNYEALAAYWYSKWGVHVADADVIARGHRRPFGNDANPLSWWPSATIAELAQRYSIAVAPERV